MAPEVPSLFSGTWSTNVGQNPGSSMGFNDTVPDGLGTTSNHVWLAEGGGDMIVQLRHSFVLETALTGIATGCEKKCKAKLTAPAFAVTACQTHLLPVNYTRDSRNINEMYRLSAASIAPSLTEQGMAITAGLEVVDVEKAYLFTGFFQGADCVGVFNYTACTLSSAIGEYDVTIDDGVLSLDNAKDPKIIALANNTQVDQKQNVSGHKSTLAGILSLFTLKWDSYITFVHQPGHKEQIAEVLTGTVAATAFQQPNEGTRGKCPQFTDAHDKVLGDLNELMVRAGAILASQDSATVSELESRTDPGCPSFQRIIKGHRVGEHDVYHTEYMYFLAAALVEVICIAAIAPTYFGWWRIGRPVSFSPLEMAKVSSSSSRKRD